jgi:hypothetical protein
MPPKNLFRPTIQRKKIVPRVKKLKIKRRPMSYAVKKVTQMQKLLAEDRRRQKELKKAEQAARRTTLTKRLFKSSRSRTRFTIEHKMFVLDFVKCETEAHGSKESSACFLLGTYFPQWFRSVKQAT